MSDHDPLMRLEDDFESDEVHHPYSAMIQGFDAAEQGIPQSLNPYEEDTREYHSWNTGYESFEELNDYLL